jgi:hypothetical protein
VVLQRWEAFLRMQNTLQVFCSQKNQLSLA